MLLEKQIARTKKPVTVDSLVTAFRRFGLQSGDVVLVHSSLSGLGWVNGGAVAVIQALLRSVGGDGTLVMPTQSNSLTNPQNWAAPAVPQAWIETIRETMPAYDPRTTPTQDMGQVAELFRTWPGAVRSDHPSASFAALGPLATQVTRDHELSDPLGTGSPLGTLYELGAKVLLIGVGFDKCTALHLAERIVWPDRPRVAEGAPLLIAGERRWTSFDVPQLMDGEAFCPIGASALRSGIASAGPIGEGQAIAMGLRELVDHAVGMWSAKPDQR